MMRVVKHWSRLPREVVEYLSPVIQNQAGHGPELPALGDPGLSTDLGLGDPQKSLPT